MEQGICVRVFGNGANALIQHDGGYAVASLGGSTIRPGDDLEGNWFSPGRGLIRNVTRSADVKISLLGNWGTPFGAMLANGGP